MITLTMLLTAMLFGMKLIWNALTPIALARKTLAVKDDKPVGISMAPLVETGLLLLLILLSAISDGSAWYQHPVSVAILGIISIIGSYIIFAILGFLIGSVVSRIKSRRRTTHK